MTVRGERNRTVTFVWNTTPEDVQAGEVEVTAESRNDTVAETVTIEDIHESGAPMKLVEAFFDEPSDPRFVELYFGIWEYRLTGAVDGLEASREDVLDIYVWLFERRYGY